MKNTKYLFNEDKNTSKGMISVSQVQTFLSCKKKWEYNYIENLKPRMERSYLTIGKLCHKGMQVAMETLWRYQQNEIGVDNEFDRILDCALKAIDNEWQEYMEITPLLSEEIPNMNQMLVDAKSIFAQALEEFEPWKYEVLTVKKSGELIPALELHFVVPCPGSKGMQGFIDAILLDKETGFVWCTDYKFRKSLSPDEDEDFNIQNAVYSYACMKMGIEITGTMTWQHVNTPASDPKINKNGTISTAKIKTTWQHYAEFCKKHGQDPQDYYDDMVEKLSDIEWHRATYEYRNEETIKRVWRKCVVPVSWAIKRAHGAKANNHPSLYPWNCKMCQYQSLCQAELRDYDADAIREREYTRRTTRDEGETTKSGLAPAI